MKKKKEAQDKIKDYRSVKLLEIKKKKKYFEIYYWIGIFIFFLGILLVFKPAYDYTIIKNLSGFLFCLFVSFHFLLTEKEFEISRFIYFPIIFFTHILISCFYATFKFEAAKNLENYLLYFLIFLISSNLEIDKRIFYIWIGIGLISAIIGISNFYGEKHYAISTFGNPNFFAGHIIMVLCLSFSNVLNWIYVEGKYDRFFKFLDISCLFFGVWALLVSQSRAAIMAFIIGISFVWFIDNIEKKSSIKYIPLFILLISSFLLFPKIIVWYKTNIRYFIWRGTLRMILKKPVFGYGLGNFIFFYPYFRVREYFLQPESTPVTNHSHNEYLEIWSEMGIIGLLIFLSFIFSFIISAIRNKKSRKIFLGGIIGGIISVLLDNIFSTNLRNPSTSMYFWFLLGMTCRYINSKKIEIKFSKILWYAIFSVSLILSIFHSYYRIFPQIYYKNGISAKDSGYYTEAIENYLIVCKYNPYNYENWYKLAYVYGMVGDYKKAEQIYLYINKYLFPHFAKTDANLGTVYMKMQDMEKAFKYYKNAEYFNPYDEDVLCSIASIYLLYYNNIEKAIEYLNRVLKINPENVYANRTLSLLKKEGKIRR